jgi:NADH dehydrogenase FAD-containing subunit
MVSLAEKLLLVGGGQVHIRMLQMIKGRGRLPDCDVCLVSPNEQFYYTEMIGGYLEGDYAEAEICLDLPALCKMAKISFQRGVVSAINPLKKTVRLKDGAELSYDWLSIDIGAPLAETDVPGVEEYAVQLKPSSNMIELRQRLEEFNSDAAPVVIVGAGRPGVELALVLRQFFHRQQVTAGIKVIGRESLPLPGYPLRVRQQMGVIMEKNGIMLVKERCVEGVTCCDVHLQDGGRLPFSLLLWATDRKAPPLFAASGLPTNEQGYLRVSRLLFCSDYPEIFGAGDCVTVAGVPKSQMVRCQTAQEASVLTHNLRMAMGTPRFKLYKPQKNYPEVLFLGGGIGLLHYAGFSAAGRWCWQLKDWIDRRFMRRHRP